jgi:hypothetical protein
MAHLVTCEYPKCSCKYSRKLGFHIILKIISGNDEKIWPNFKVCNYTFNFMAMPCLLWLIVLWHLSMATRLFLVACVYCNYKWVANSIIDFQISFSVICVINISWEPFGLVGITCGVVSTCFFLGLSSVYHCGVTNWDKSNFSVANVITNLQWSWLEIENLDCLISVIKNWLNDTLMLVLMGLVSIRILLIFLAWSLL